MINLRNLILPIATTLIFGTSQAFAGGADGLGLPLGGVFGVGLSSSHGFYVEELKDWHQTNADSTSVLGSQCGVSYEAMLIGNNSSNYLYVAVQNPTNETLQLDVTNSRFSFSSGIERLPDLDPNTNGISIESKAMGAFFLPFPSKSDFIGAGSIQVHIPVQVGGNKNGCELKAVFLRDANVVPLTASVQSRTSFEFSLGFGGPAFESADFDQLQTAQGADLSFYGFANANHGIHVSAFSFTKGPLQSDLGTNIKGVSDAHSSLAYAGVALGYTYRFEPDQDWQYSVDFGVGVAGFSYRKDDQPKIESTNDFATYSKANVMYRIASKPNGYKRRDLFVVLSLFDLWTPNGSLEGIPLKGHTAGGLLSFRLGY